VAVAEVLVSLHEHILNVFARNFLALEVVVGPLDIFEIASQVEHNPPGHLRAEVARKVDRVFEHLVDRLAVGVGAAVLPELLVPLVADLVEAPEIHRSPAHRAGRVGSRALLVPGLYATRAEGVAAGQLAERPRLAVAD